MTSPLPPLRELFAVAEREVDPAPISHIHGTFMVTTEAGLMEMARLIERHRIEFSHPMWVREGLRLEFRSMRHFALAKIVLHPE